MTVKLVLVVDTVNQVHLFLSCVLKVLSQLLVPILHSQQQDWVMQLHVHLALLVATVLLKVWMLLCLVE